MPALISGTRIVLNWLGSNLSPNTPLDTTFPRTATSTIDLIDAYGAEGRRWYNWYEAARKSGGIFVHLYLFPLYSFGAAGDAARK